MCCRRRGSQRFPTASGGVQPASPVDSCNGSINFELAYPQFVDVERSSPEVAAIFVQIWCADCDTISPECRRLVSATLVCEVAESLSVPPSAVSDEHGNAACFGMRLVTAQECLEPSADPPTIIALGFFHLGKSACVAGDFASVSGIATTVGSPRARIRIKAAIQGALRRLDSDFADGFDPMHENGVVVSRVALYVAPGKAPPELTESELDLESRRNQLEKRKETEQRAIFGVAPWALQSDNHELSDKDFVPHMDMFGRLYPPLAPFPVPEPSVPKSVEIADTCGWHKAICLQEPSSGGFALCAPVRMPENEGDSPRLASTAASLVPVTRPDGEVQPRTLEGLIAPSFGGRLAPTGAA